MYLNFKGKGFYSRVKKVKGIKFILLKLEKYYFYINNSIYI